MENSEVKRKKSKLKELHDLEDKINKEINVCDRKIRGCFFDIKLAIAKKQKLGKRISHNMRLRNKIISELP